MDQSQSYDVTAAVSEHTPASELAPSLGAPPSTSVLSDAPMTDSVEPAESQDSLPKPPVVDGTALSTFETPRLSEQTECILKRVNANAANAAAVGTPGWEAAKEQVLRDMATSDKFPTPTPPRDTTTPKRGGRGGKRASFVTDGDAMDVKAEGITPQPTPASRGRGRGGGRPRGRGRGGGRGGKRKREDRSDDDSEDSEVYSPVVTTTKSGRSIQKPTSFVPPPQSPTTAGPKRKRPYRRNPESAVCKVCLRGTSPASNMIVFCDGCNTPYHQYCHHPPIDKAVVEEVDKEWYCKQCEKERVVPVPESEIADFISAGGASVEQRQRYFASLPPGMLVTLLTRATTLKPDLPVFAPDFQARTASTTNVAPGMSTAANGHAHPQTTTPTAIAATATARSAPQATGGATNNGLRYADQSEEPVPEGHPPNYPRPGYGLMSTLPPEQEDLQWLVDDGDRFGVFSHMYQVDPQAAHSGLGGGMSMGQ
ncbi:hypothetical protein LTR37_018067 [Vermiconidia calcicola]|uniref:Uncharacterized protein n=1 Tax=Vermiconidia calcicola TaxID=1690605 RepID=A0ACC3MIA4_9PEZI|nr:hypothetical protein LTR37_018067 [Vermiconidia calcicola]